MDDRGATAVEASGYDIPVGTFEEALAMVGTRAPVRFGEIEVNWPMIKLFCALVHDANPAYWDEGFARRRFGAIVAPPAMLMTWLMPLEWKPGGAKPVPLLMARVPLPGTTIINVANEVELLEPVRVGDHLNVEDELVAVSPEKATAVGKGHFVTTRSTYRRQDGREVAVMTNVLLRFTPETAPHGVGERAGAEGPDPDAGGLAPPRRGSQRGASPGSGTTGPRAPSGETANTEDRAPRGAPSGALEAETSSGGHAERLEYGETRAYAEVQVGDEVGPVEDLVTYRRVIMNPAATWDFFPGHYDPEYARSQGQPTIYVNAMHLMGFVDRVATEWAGPESRVVHRRVELRRSVFAGDTMVASGAVVGKPRSSFGPQRPLVELALDVRNQHGELCCASRVTLEVPARALSSGEA